MIILNLILITIVIIIITIILLIIILTIIAILTKFHTDKEGHSWSRRLHAHRQDRCSHHGRNSL